MHKIIRNPFTLNLLALIILCLPLSLIAEQQTPQTPSWDAFTEQLKPLDEKMLAMLPERLRNDPQIQQEVGRLLLSTLASNTLDALASDPQHPVFLPWINLTMNMFQPNADTVYKAATIDPEGSYRLRGEQGSLLMFKMWQFAGSPEDKGREVGFSPNGVNDFNALSTNNQGHFDVILSQSRPENYQGDWWQLDPTTTRLWLRQVSYDWAAEQDPTISIERLDKPVNRTRPSAVNLQVRLQNLASRVANSASYLVDHVEDLRQAGFINRFRQTDYSTAGFTGQFYYEGAYELKPNEALIVTAKVPEDCQYWSLILTNDIYETTDWYNNHSSLNGAQARIDQDNLVRVVISENDPGVNNWLDTAGYLTGAVQGRWTDCSANPIPEIKKVAFDKVLERLPADTPRISAEQREAKIRQRRAQLQQRPLW